MERPGGRGGQRPNAGRKRGEPTRVVRLPVPIADIVRRYTEKGYKPGDVAGFYEVEARMAAAIPLMSASAACGFPSPAEDYEERKLDFNELLIHNLPATFTVRVAGESMTGAGIFPGDLAIIDRSIDAFSGCIVLACLGREFTIKRYRLRAGVVTLVAENPEFPNITIAEGDEFEIWGVITNTIRRLLP